MTVATFDTLKFARKLKEAGVPERQAEAEAEALSEAFDSTVLTKADLLEALSPVNGRISDLSERMARMEGDMRLIKWMLALVILVTVLPVLKTLLS